MAFYHRTAGTHPDSLLHPELLMQQRRDRFTPPIAFCLDYAVGLTDKKTLDDGLEVSPLTKYNMFMAVLMVTCSAALLSPLSRL